LGWPRAGSQVKPKKFFPGITKLLSLGDIWRLGKNGENGVLGAPCLVKDPQPNIWGGGKNGPWAFFTLGRAKLKTQGFFCPFWG